MRAGLTVWFTGLSSAGKSTISRAVYDTLLADGARVELLHRDEAAFGGSQVPDREWESVAKVLAVRGRATAAGKA